MCVCVSGGASVRSAGQRRAVSGPAVARDGPQHLQGPPEVHRRLLHTLPWSVSVCVFSLCVCVRVFSLCVCRLLSCPSGCYFTGDGALRSEDGFYQITGRMDDVINVSGHRLGTAEIEDALVRLTSCPLSAFPVCSEFDCRRSAGRTPGYSRVGRHWLPARHQGRR